MVGQLELDKREREREREKEKLLTSSKITKKVPCHCQVYFIWFVCLLLSRNRKLWVKRKAKTNKFVLHECITKFCGREGELGERKGFALENHTVTSLYTAGRPVKHFLAIYRSPANFKPLSTRFRMYHPASHPHTCSPWKRNYPNREIYHSNGPPRSSSSTIKVRGTFVSPTRVDDDFSNTLDDLFVAFYRTVSDSGVYICTFTGEQNVIT